MIKDADKKRIITRYIKALCKILGIDHEINVRWRYQEGDIAATNSQPEYKRTTFNFNLEELHTEEDLLAIVIHETAHVVSWPLYHVAGELASSTFETEAVRVANESITTAWERIIYALVQEDLLE